MKEKSFISYLDDNDEQKKCFANILEINNAFCKFDNGANIILLPIPRILKIKEKSEKVIDDVKS